jgi:NDP-sugar pyrophosphorylase family protein
MQAVILAGGKGTRLRPYTTVLPKPLMPIGDMPILEVVLRQLQRSGFTRVTLAVSYLAELIEAFCGDGSRFGLELAYSRETKPLSTAGPLKLVPGLDDTFLTTNGDLLTTLDFASLVRFHRETKAAATIAVHRRTAKIDYGVVETEDDGSLRAYIEKPQFPYRVSMGVNVFEPWVTDHIADGETLGIPDLMLRLKEAGKTVMTYEAPCLWYDIGRHEDYEEAMDVFEAKRTDFLEGPAA